ncbi:MAG: hypothetical protein ACP6KW_12770, partial [Candidatus Thorarchaeota archaeon]
WYYLLRQETFTGKPAGWTDSEISYYSGGFHETGFFAGYLYCSDVNTAAYDSVRFTLNIGGSWTDAWVYVLFWNGTDFSLVGNFTSGTATDQTFTSSDPIYQRADFKVQVYYGGFDGSDSFDATDWRIEGRNTTTYSAFQTTYLFTGVDFDTYSVEELHVDYTAGATADESLQFRLETGDTTPDALVYNSDGQSDFILDIHAFLNGPECYLQIRDTDRNEQTGSSWSIDRLFIRLISHPPTVEGPPIASGLVDGTHALAQYNPVSVTFNVSDPEGYQNIEFVELGLTDNQSGTDHFTLTYSQSNDSFAVGLNPEYVDLLSTNCSVVTLGTSITLTFVFRTTFPCGHIDNVTYRVSVTDIDGLSSGSVSYPGGWTIESRLALVGGLAIDDDVGTPDRGPVDASLSVSGTLCYLGFPSTHPNTSLEIALECENVTGSPWMSSDYNASEGTFTILAQADNEVGKDTYSLSVRSAGVNYLQGETEVAYIADMIVCQEISSPSYIVDSSKTGYMNVSLRYAYDGSPVVSGTFWLVDLLLTRLEGGNWTASFFPGHLMSRTFDTVTTNASDLHGIGVVDMNGAHLTMYWEELVCHIEGPLFTTVEVGTNATGITCWAEYYFRSDHGQVYTGTLHLNDTTFIYDSPGIHAYEVAYAEGDDEWGVTTIRSSDVTYCIWESGDTPEPSDPWSLYAAMAGVTAGVIAIVMVAWVARRTRVPVAQEENLDTALDYLDKISAERKKEPDENT